MANRFTDTEKWRDPWFCSLTERERGFWMYLCDNCNNAGIWQVNWPLVNYYFPEFAQVFEFNKFKERIIEISEHKWFIKKYVLFQQKINDLGELNPDNNAHKSIISILNSCNIKIEGLASPKLGGRQGLGSPPGNIEGKGKVMVKTKEGSKIPTIEEIKAYCLEAKLAVNVDKFYDYYTANGWIQGKGKPIKDWKAACRNWTRSEFSKTEVDKYDGIPLEWRTKK